MRIRSRSRGLWICLGLVAGIAIASGVGGATAAIPGPDGVIMACYHVDGHGELDNDGKIRLIDPSSSRKDALACKKDELALNWNQTGLPGEKGDKGDPGTPGAKGDKG